MMEVIEIGVRERFKKQAGLREEKMQTYYVQ